MFNLFQFHYGTVKSADVRTARRTELPFQFHYGTVKRRRKSRCTSSMQMHFNSTTVRLKDGYTVTFPSVVNIFQFHYGTVKRPTRQMFSIKPDNFNSTTVRLKVSPRAGLFCKSNYFNSTTVRLKGLIIRATGVR